MNDTDRLTDTQAVTHAHRQTDRQTHTQTDTHTVRHTDRQTDAYTDRHSHSQTHRQKDRQTDCNFHIFAVFLFLFAPFHFSWDLRGKLFLTGSHG